MSKKTEHIIAVLKKTLGDVDFQKERDKRAVVRAFKAVASEFGVNESTVRDKCTRGLGFSTDSFFSALVNFADGNGGELLSRLSPDDAGEVKKLLSSGAASGFKIVSDTHNCYNTMRDSGFVVMDNMVYFISEMNGTEKLIYGTALDRAGATEPVFDGAMHGLHTLGGVIKNLRCWGGKLFFIYEDDLSTVFCSYDPASQIFEQIADRWQVCSNVESGMCYSIRRQRNISELISVRLNDSCTETRELPIVGVNDWIDMPRKFSKNSPVLRWSVPIVRNGYLYTSVENGVECSVRFSLNNPNDFEFLPYGAVIYRNKPTLFAAGGNVLMLENNKHGFWSLSESNLERIGVFDNKIPMLQHNWVQYGKNYLVENGVLYRIDRNEEIGSVHPNYGYMKDAIVLQNMTVAFGYCDDKPFIYRIPNAKMFKPGTNLDDYARPLF